MKSKIYSLLIIITLLASLVLVGVSCRKVTSEPIVIPEPSYWPTNGWEEATPESQGFNSEKLADSVKCNKTKRYGYTQFDDCEKWLSYP